MSKIYSGANGIRGLAVLLVLFVHSANIFFPGSKPYLMGVGKIGVWLFFVLSAFLLAKKFIHHPLSPLLLASYLSGRFLRIIPMFIIALFFYYFLGYYSWDEFFNILTFKTGFAHLWTIPVEFKFYFLLPFITYFSYSIFAKYGLFGLIFSTTALIFIHQSIFPFWDLKGNSIEMLWYIPSFLTGIVASIIHEHGISIKNWLSTLLIIIIALSFIVSSPGVLYYSFGVEMSNYLQKQFIPLSILWSLFIILLIDGTSSASKFVTASAMNHLGKWSFSIYLFHYGIYLKVAEYYPQNYMALSLSFIASIIAGGVSYNIIEKNIDTMRHSLSNYIMKITTPKRNQTS